jgi:hypothetical protein
MLNKLVRGLAMFGVAFGLTTLGASDAQAHACTHPECGSYEELTHWYTEYCYPPEGEWYEAGVEVWQVYVRRCDMPPGNPGSCTGYCAQGNDRDRDCFQYQYENHSCPY